MTATAMAGAAAGLGVAVPIGAVGVLLVQEGMRGWRRAAAAAAAVATVDMAYAAVATALGPLVADALSGVEAWVRLVSAAVLVAIAARGLVASRRSTDARERAAVGGGAVRTFGRFAALTLINPTTALYFAALTTAQGGSLGHGGAGVVFVAGVFLASLLWQQFIVAAGAFAGTRITGAARVWTFRVGYGLIIGYAALLAVPLP
ncbi:lysine transporter LysE [Wenjunlia tyrosinilytica]|uniref:Lysine transporter LysE n=1 Tax=Wenjunlia tyrosinilytica TaxID=1544741 RepID=A0A917ZT92_9ACTN|nr:lysine transporter LysE [Wenjunlia tyrosinilytica]